MKKQILAIVLMLSLAIGLIPITAAAVDETYKYWDQGDYRWGSMSLSPSGYGPSMALQGCYVTAVAKLLVHAGQQDQTTFTPQKCLEGMYRHGMLNSAGEVCYNNFNNGFLQEFGPDLEKVYTEPWDMDKATAIREVSKEINDGYYVMVYVKSQWGRSEHYMAVDYVSDDIYVMDNNRVIALYREGPSYGYSNVKDLVRFKYHGDKPYPAIGGITTVTIQPGLYSLAPACAPDSRLEVAEGSLDIQANVRIGTANGDTAQQWEISALGDRYYKLISKKSGHALDVAGAGTTAGTNVQQYWWTENRAQHWCFIDAGDGYYQIVTRLNTGLRLDVSGGAATNGTNVQIWTENGNSAQKWKLIPVTSDPKDDATSTTTTVKKTQYRYHRYEDGFGEFAVCAHYGNSLPTAAGPMYIKYTDWMDSPLPAVSSDYLVHPFQSGPCINAGCVERADSTSLRYRDSAGNIWYYEETRTVTVDEPSAPPPETPKPTTPDPAPSCDRGHTWQWEAVKPVTCEESGLEERVCEMCGERETRSIAASGHTWGEWEVVVPATCNGDGQSERVCKVCGETGVRITEALSHKYSVKQETDALTIYVCANCGDSYQKEKETPHTADPNTPPATQPKGVLPLPVTRSFTPDAFWDVKGTDWFYGNVADTYEMGLMNGTGADTFSPGNNMTLAEVVTLAARIHRLYHNGEEHFARYDGGNWYDPYVNYARENRIIDVNYDYSRPATREEFVHILARSLPEEELANIAGTVSFADSRDIVYISDVRLLSGAGVINGIPENGQTYFKPSATITRAEVAAVVARMARPDSRIRP